jgi:hypothetical protein
VSQNCKKLTCISYAFRRREALRSFGAAVLVLFAYAKVPSSVATAQTLEKRPINEAVRKLARALRDIGLSKTLGLARELESLNKGESYFDVHLRDADVRHKHALILATSLGQLTFAEAGCIRSFSLSYNGEIGDIGISAIVRELPPSLSELGLDECGIGDVAGEHLLAWAGKSSKSLLLCIEGNRFSQNLRKRFITLSDRSKNIKLVI